MQGYGLDRRWPGTFLHRALSQDTAGSTEALLGWDVRSGERGRRKGPQPGTRTPESESNSASNWLLTWCVPSPPWGSVSPALSQEAYRLQR